MATNIDTVNVGGTDYYVAANGAAVNSFTSSDVADGSATAWTSVTTLAASDTNKTILEKTSQMFKNIRYLYAQLAGKANSSHNHAAGDITSGKLGTARGGTGITSNPSMLTNLATTSAASVFAASPRPGVTGTLGVGNLPTSSTQTNSNSYIPTSALVYSMNQTLISLNDAYDALVASTPDYPYKIDATNAMILTSSTAITTWRKAPHPLYFDNGGYRGSTICYDEDNSNKHVFISNVADYSCYSNDGGLTWTKSTRATTLPNNAEFGKILKFKNKYIAIQDATSNNPTNLVAGYSTDGSVWNWSTLPTYNNKGTNTTGAMGGVMAANSTCIIAPVRNQSGNPIEYVYRSTDGQTWTLQKINGTNYFGISPTPPYLFVANDKFITTMYNGSTYVPAYSTDGLTWTTSGITLNVGTSLTSAASCNSGKVGDKWVLVISGSSTSSMFYSTNGLTWTQIQPSTGFGNLLITNYNAFVDGKFFFQTGLPGYQANIRGFECIGVTSDLENYGFIPMFSNSTSYYTRPNIFKNIILNILTNGSALYYLPMVK